MSFKAGEYVTYKTQGICKISGVVKREICGKTEDYFELHPVYDESVNLFVPVENAKLTGRMQKLITREEIDGIICKMPEEEDIWIENETKRRETYRTILASGNRYDLVKLIRTLYKHKQSLEGTTRKLHVSDERFMKEAEKLLHEEFAFVLGIEPSQVVPYITKQIES